MYAIGVTGGIGSGKSEVLNYLKERWDAYILRLDDVSRSLLEPDGALYGEAVRLFGEEIVKEDQSLDRAQIAARIFENETERDALDALIHPAVKRETIRLMGEQKEAGTDLFVVEAALLIEDHYDALCDEMWYIYADTDTRYRRLISSRGYTEERIQKTMEKQLSEEEFRAHAGLVIDNSGDFALTKAQIDRRVRKLIKGRA